MGLKALNPSRKQIVLLKLVAWLGCLSPFFYLFYRAKVLQDVTANPIEFFTLNTGTSALVMLLVTLAVSPLRKLTNQPWLIRFRRLFGLFAFFYGCLHLAIYFVDKIGAFSEIPNDIVKRPFITLGFLAWLLMLPLALTSTAWSIRKLGGKRWNRLHTLVYLSAGAAVIHFWWKVKADHTEPAVYGSILLALLGYRVIVRALSGATQPQSLAKQG